MGIVKSLFGGSSQKSTQQSGNKAYDLLSGALGDSLGYTSEGGNALAALLGLRGGGEQAAANANWRNTPGYQFQMDEGRNAITGSLASKGLLNSGAAAKSLARFGQGLADSTYNSYLDRLTGFSNLGQDSARTLAGAGQWSQGNSSGSSSSGGLGKALGFGLSLLGV